MSGIRIILISKEGKAYRIPIPKDFKYKPIPELSNQEVLEVHISYYTENRRPTQIIDFYFNRITLNENGGYEITGEIVSQEIQRIFSNMIGSLDSKNKTVYLPKKPVLPTDKEKTCILQYIKEHLKPLYNDAPYKLEVAIRQRIIDFEKQLKKAKEISKAMD